MAFEVNARASYPWSTIVYIAVSYVDAQTGLPASVFDPVAREFVTGARASGVVVGRNDVLTAAHVVQPPSWLDLSRYAIQVQVFPGADTSPFSAPFGAYTAAGWAQYRVAVNTGTISILQSQYDFALLSFAEPLGDRVGWMALDARNHGSGTGEQTGYPGSGTGMMKASVTYTANADYYVYHTSEQTGPGASGGPLWYSNADGAHVLGVLSSGGASADNYASLAAPGVIDWLNGQMAANDVLIAATTAVTLDAPRAIATLTTELWATGRTTDRGDTIVTAASYLPAWRIDGGAGTDCLVVSDGGSIDLANISSVEILDLRGTVRANTVSNMGGEFTTVLLGPRGDTVTITAAAAIVAGGIGDDMVTVRSSGAKIDGGGGTDTVVFLSPRSGYRLIPGSTTSSGAATDSAYTLINIERLHFADAKLAFDLGGSAGNTARIIGAAFGVAELTPAHVGIGIQLFDLGVSMLQVAEAALNTELFTRIAGSRGDEAVVRTLYANVVGHAPPEADLRYFLDLLQAGVSQADLLVFAAGTDLNAQRLDLVGLAATGLEYL